MVAHGRLGILRGGNDDLEWVEGKGRMLLFSCFAITPSCHGESAREASVDDDMRGRRRDPHRWAFIRRAEG